MQFNLDKNYFVINAFKTLQWLLAETNKLICWQNQYNKIFDYARFQIKKNQGIVYS
jgi:hypothetical protein